MHSRKIVDKIHENTAHAGRSQARVDCPQSDDFLAASQLILSLGPQDCHPAVYRNRCRIAESLRRMAAQPDCQAHQSSLRLISLMVLAREPPEPGT